MNKGVWNRDYVQLEFLEHFSTPNTFVQRLACQVYHNSRSIVYQFGISIFKGDRGQMMPSKFLCKHSKSNIAFGSM